MRREHLREGIAIELELMDATVQELLALQRDAAARELAIREKTAAAAFLGQFYSGVENIFKRISRFRALRCQPVLPGMWTCSSGFAFLLKTLCRPCLTIPFRPLWRRFVGSGMLFIKAMVSSWNEIAWPKG